MSWLIQGKPGSSITDYKLPKSDEILSLFEHFEGSVKQLLIAMVPNRNLRLSMAMQMLKQLENDDKLEAFAKIRDLAEDARMLLDEDEIAGMISIEGANKRQKDLNDQQIRSKLRRMGGNQATKNSALNDLDDE